MLWSTAQNSENQRVEGDKKVDGGMYPDMAGKWQKHLLHTF